MLLKVLKIYLICISTHNLLAIKFANKTSIDFCVERFSTKHHDNIMKKIIANSEVQEPNAVIMQSEDGPYINLYIKQNLALIPITLPNNLLYDDIEIYILQDHIDKNLIIIKDQDNNIITRAYKPKPKNKPICTIS